MDVVSPIYKRWQHEAQSDPEAFWAKAAREVFWFRTWDRVLEWEPPTFRWFTGATTNISYNCLDLQVERGNGGRTALIAEHEDGSRRLFTYAQLLGEVKRVAAALRALGVRRGDRVAIYMPTMPEAIMTMLATTRIGAIHLVVFAGFGSGALAERCRLAGTRVMIVADQTTRKGNPIDLWKLVKDALAQPGSPIEKVVMLARGKPVRRFEAGPRHSVGGFSPSWRRTVHRLRTDGSQRARLCAGDVGHHRQPQDRRS